MEAHLNNHIQHRRGAAGNAAHADENAVKVALGAQQQQHQLQQQQQQQQQQGKRQNSVTGGVQQHSGEKRRALKPINAVDGGAPVTQQQQQAQQLAYVQARERRRVGGASPDRMSVGGTASPAVDAPDAMAISAARASAHASRATQQATMAAAASLNDSFDLETEEFMAGLDSQSMGLHDHDAVGVVHRARPADIDAKDHARTQLVAVYAREIMEHLFMAETRALPAHDYMSRCSDVLPNMRRVLCDWLVEVQLEFNIDHHALYLAINLIDRYLSRRDVQRRMLQLVGVSAVLIASKIEDMRPVAVDDLVFVTANTYTRDELLAMERDMLAVLDFECCVPTGLDFLRRFSKAASLPSASHALAMFLLECCTVLSYDMQAYRPSMVAAACVVAARHLTNERTLWTPELEFETHLTSTSFELRTCVNEVLALHRAIASSESAVQNKYANAAWGQVSLVRPAAHDLPADLAD